MSRQRAPGAWGFAGETLRLAGPVGLFTPWIPPQDGAGLDHSVQTVAAWYALCLVLMALGGLFTRRAREGHWPCWSLGGHRWSEVDNGWVVCTRCLHGERLVSSERES